MNTQEIEKLTLEWSEFITLKPEDMINKILHLSYWQNKLTKLMIEEQLLQAKLQVRVRKRVYELQYKRLEGETSQKYKTVGEIEVYRDGDDIYNELMLQIDESKACEKLYKEMLQTSRDISHYVKTYIDFKREFGV